MKNKLIHIIICACTFLWTLFIWSNSLRSGVVSGEVSAGVTALINKMLEYLSAGSVPEHFVRKSAHFTEFAVLGLLLALSVLPLALRPKWTFAAVLSLLAACVDELLQLLSVGRSCQLTDVVIDISGAVLGVLAVMLVFESKKPAKSANLQF
ncbi:MAG TPA: VanZ family protein [Clostridiales bacterium]|jgi:VanZ family protein|nr:VanZ family protein [Clostridiales bacterium]